MKVVCWLFLLLLLGMHCFAQTASRGEPLITFSCPAEDTGNTPFRFTGLAELFDFSPGFDMFRTVQMDSESEQTQPLESIFTGAPQWVKDLRRGEIVFFGTMPVTVFFTRTIMGLVRMGQHNWDQRYAPWPFQSAGAVAMTNQELIRMFSIAASVSLVISLADHLVVRNKRKAALASDY